MNSNTALVMFAVLAAIGLAATLVAPIILQAHATVIPKPSHPSQCHDAFDGPATGKCAKNLSPPEPGPPP